MIFNNLMKCEKCNNNFKFTCARCSCGYYCSRECQQNDWAVHKKFCKLWSNPKKDIFYNPFYAAEIVREPKRLECIPINEKFTNFSREYQGETQLHLAIINGNLEIISNLIKNGAYVNTIDYRINSPLYYACSHNGKDNVLNKNKELRKKIVELLLDKGSDPFHQGGVSGMRTFEIAKNNGLKDIYDFIVNHKYFRIWEELRKYINKSSPPEKVAKISRRYVDLFWRSRSLHWLFALGRENMANIKPHEKILENLNYDNYEDSIESMFKDCYYRHLKMLENFETFLSG